MTDRKYSVKEIDYLRKVVKQKVAYGSYLGPATSGTYAVNSDEDRLVEDRVRTYMLAGLTAEDLIAQATKDEKQVEAYKNERVRRIL